MGFSAGLLPWAPVRGPACCLISVTQGWAGSVLRTEILAEGGQGPEQTAALLSRPGPRGQRCLTGRWGRVTGDLGEARGSQGPTPGQSGWIWLFFSFLRAKGPHMV